MSLINIKRHIQAVRQNKGVLYTDAFQFVKGTADPTDANLDNGRMYYLEGTGFRAYAEGDWFTIPTSTSGTSGSSWDELYAADKTLTINGTTLTYNLTHATGDGLTMAAGAGAAGAVIQFANSGSGSDIQGTSDTWSISKAGLVTCVGVTTTGDITSTGGAIDWDLIDNNASALSIDASGKAGLIAVVTTNDSEGITMSGILTVAGAVTASTGLTVTAGGIAVADGVTTLEDNQNTANAVTITNDTMTTWGNATDAGVVEITSSSLTTGFALNISLSDTALAGGGYIRCWEQDDGDAQFSVGEGGATVIGGAASGTDALTLTAGDITVTSGDITVTEGSVVVTNTANETAFTVVADSVTDGIVLDINADGVTTGTLLHLDSTAATFAGKYIDCFDGAASDFSVGLYGATVIAGNAAGTDALTVTAGDILLNDSDQNVIESEDGTSTLLLLDNKAGAVGSGEAVLKVDAGGVVNAAGFGIYATFTGAAAAGATVIGVVPDAGSVGVKINGGSVDTREALYVDADPTAYDVAYIHTDGVIADNKAVLSLHSAGAMAAGSSILRLAQAGTPAAATAYTFEIDNTDSTTTNNAVAVRIDNHTSTGAVIQATSAGASAPLLDLYSTNAGATGVVLKTTHTSASPADDDVVASVQFWGVDDAGSEEFGRIETMIVDATSATSASAMKFYVDVAGTAETALTLKTNYAIVGGGGDTGYVTSNGAYNLVLNTNEGTDSGTITITDAANGDIIITPNGSGQTQLFAPALQVTNKTSAATLTIAEVGVITADTTSGAFSLTLPAAATSAGAMYKIIKTDAAANAVTIDGNGAELINGSATYAGIDAQYDTATVYCNGTAWFITESIIA
jgi:hypothetical protein